MRRASADQYIPQCSANRRPLIAWLILGSGTLFIIALVLAAPLAQANGFAFLAASIYQTFGHICHQLPERSFFIAGQKVAVCSRCSGLYFGFAAAVIFYPLFFSLRRTQTPERKWLFLSAVPLAVDFGLGLFGLWENTHWSRFITGSLLGGTVILYVMPALAEISLRGKRPSFIPRQSSQSGSSTNITRESLASAPSDYSAPERRI